MLELSVVSIAVSVVWSAGSRSGSRERHEFPQLEVASLTNTRPPYTAAHPLPLPKLSPDGHNNKNPLPIGLSPRASAYLANFYMLDFLHPQVEQLQVLVPLEHAQLVPHPQAIVCFRELIIGG